MFSIIPDVYAASSGAAGSQPAWLQFAPFILIFAIFYFLVIRPQQKKAKVHQQMISGVVKGDQVITSSGIYGSISKVTDDFVLVEVSDKTNIKLAKSHISEIITKKKSEKEKDNSKDKKDKKDKE